MFTIEPIYMVHSRKQSLSCLSISLIHSFTFIVTLSQSSMSFYLSQTILKVCHGVSRRQLTVILLEIRDKT